MIYQGFLATTLFLMVWLSAAVPGYVTTVFVGRVQRRLAAAAHEATRGGVQVESAATALIADLRSLLFVSYPLVVV